MRPAGAADMAMGGIGGTAASTSSVPGVAVVEPPPFWSTPTPYLFIGFGVVMALIAVALAVLLCTRRKDGGRGVGGGGGGEEGVVVVPPGMMSVRVLAPLDREAPPRVVVVMAGDDSPSFLASATPLAFAATGVPLAPAAAKVVAPPPPCSGSPAPACVDVSS